MNKEKKQVLVVHPGKQHSMQTALGLYEAGMLAGYITCIYQKKGSITNFVTVFLRGKNRKKAEGRKSVELPDDKIIIRGEITALIGRVLSRITNSSKAFDIWNNHLNRVFARKVLRYIKKNPVDAVISYDNNSDYLFQKLKDKYPSVKRIMDVSIANRIYMKEIFEREICNRLHTEVGTEVFKKDGLYQEWCFLWDKKTVDRLSKEVSLTELFLVASETVKKSLLYLNVSEDRIQKVPYGANLKTFTKKEIDSFHSPLRLIFVGNISYRKGCHLLFSLAKEMGDSIHLSVIGECNNALANQYKDCENIDFKGFLTHDLLVQEYHKADVFVLPSLGEGMAMVGLEALSCGLPVICTEMSGINDLIEDGKNGYVVKTGDFHELKACIQSIALKKSMREENVYHDYSWDKYRFRLANTVLDYLEK